MKRRKMFTLVELMIVVAIIAILAALLLPALMRARMRTNYERLVKGQEVTAPQTEILIEHLKGNKEYHKELAKEYGQLPEKYDWLSYGHGVKKRQKTKTLEADKKYQKKMREEVEKALAPDEMTKLKAQIASLEKQKKELENKGKLSKFTYKIEGKKINYNWMYVVIRSDNQEIVQFKGRSDCERIIEFLEAAFENGTTYKETK